MNYEEFKKINDEDILKLVKHPLEEGCLPLLHFNKLEETGLVTSCFTTREGGVSTGIFSELNLSFTRGDDYTSVRTNYRRLAQAMGVTENDFVCSDQTHTTNVLRVDSRDRGNGVTKDRPYTDVDGLITNEAGLVLSTFYADCVPLYFLDPVNKAIGLSHSGWKGTVGRMGRATLLAMKKEFNTNPKDVIAAIGPSICQACYEVSEDVALRFQEEFKEDAKEILYDKGNGKYQLDLWKTNAIVLQEAGVKRENIAVTNICTCCNPKLLFSHRASKGKRGNLGAFMYLK